MEELTRRGVLFAACSGRQYGNLRRLFGPVAHHMAFICENGALCFYGGEVIGAIPIPEETAREIIADIEAAGMNLLISGRHTTYMLDQNRAAIRTISSIACATPSPSSTGRRTWPNPC